MDWVRTGRLLVLHRLGPLAAAENRRLGGRLLPPEVAARIEPAYRATGLRNALLQETGDGLRGKLARAGIPSLRFKGSALLAAGVYPDPGGRPMDDLDLLVPSSRVTEAVELFLGLGFTPGMEWRPDLPDWLDSLTLTVPKPPGGIPLVVDLHWRTEYGTPRFGADSRGGEESPLWEDADLEAGLPGPAAHLVILAEHILKHIAYQTHFLGLADLGRLIPLVSTWDRMVTLARSRPGAPGVGLLLKGLEEELEAPVPREVIRSLGGSRPWIQPVGWMLRPSRLVGRTRLPRSRIRGGLLRGALLGSPLTAVGVVAGTLWPRERWLRARYRSPSATVASLRMRYLSDILHWSLGRGTSPVSPDQPGDLAA